MTPFMASSSAAACLLFLRRCLCGSGISKGVAHIRQVGKQRGTERRSGYQRHPSCLQTCLTYSHPARTDRSTSPATAQPADSTATRQLLRPAPSPPPPPPPPLLGGGAVKPASRAGSSVLGSPVVESSTAGGRTGDMYRSSTLVALWRTPSVAAAARLGSSAETTLQDVREMPR
jgi:hypothetical protein